MQQAAARMREVIQAPMPIIAQSILAAATLAAQPHADVVIDGRKKPISNNFITIGESGERKSACDSLANFPIYEKQQQLKFESVQNKFELEADLAVWKKAREKVLASSEHKSSEEKKQALLELGEPPAFTDPMLLTEEPTYEGLIKALHSGQPSMGLFSDEGGRFLGGFAMSKDNATKTITGLSKLWDGSPITRTRGEEGNLLIYGRRLSMHIMIQPLLAGQIFSNPMLVGQGFMNRCLCSFPETNIGNRRYKEADLASDAALAGYFNNMNYLLEKEMPLTGQKDMGLQPCQIELDATAKRMWISFHDHIENLQKEDQSLFPIKGFASKAAEHASRIAAVLSIYNNAETTEISAQFVEAGIQIAQFYISESLRLFHSANDDPELLLAQKVLTWAQQQGNKLSLVELYQLGPNAVRDKNKARRIIEILEGHDWVRKIQGGHEINGKQRRDVWEVWNGTLS